MVFFFGCCLLIPDLLFFPVRFPPFSTARSLCASWQAKVIDVGKPVSEADCILSDHRAGQFRQYPVIGEDKLCDSFQKAAFRFFGQVGPEHPVQIPVSVFVVDNVAPQVAPGVQVPGRVAFGFGEAVLQVAGGNDQGVGPMTPTMDRTPFVLSYVILAKALAGMDRPTSQRQGWTILVRFIV